MFFAFIRTAPGKFIQCETEELWWMMEPDRDGFASYLRERISTFSVRLYERIWIPGFPREVSKPWIELLKESKAIGERGIVPTTPESLCGYPWIRKVPWQSG